MAKLDEYFRNGLNAFGNNLATLGGATVIALVLSLVSLGLFAPSMVGGLFLMALAALRGQPVEVRHVLGGLRFFGATLVAGFLTAVFVGIGLALGIIPGLVILPLWVFAIPLIVDRDMSAWDAMETSRKEVTRRFGTLWLLVAILVGLMGLAVNVVPAVGGVVAKVIVVCVVAAAYNDIFGADWTQPQPAEPNCVQENSDRAEPPRGPATRDGADENATESSDASSRTTASSPESPPTARKPRAEPGDEPDWDAV